jgi:hypothetical protein
LKAVEPKERTVSTKKIRIKYIEFVTYDITRRRISPIEMSLIVFVPFIAGMYPVKIGRFPGFEVV